MPYTLTNDGYVFPVEMSPQEMDRHKKSMILTDFIFTNHDPLYELGDPAPMFTFLVKKTEPSPGAGDIAVSVHRSRWSTMTAT